MYSKLGVFARHRMDVSAQDLLFGLRSCVRTPHRKSVTEDILRTCSSEDDGLVCLSVRTGFDLLLGVLEWPAGEDIIVSAVTHPDMIRIIQAHGLRPVPVDVDLQTLAPRPGFLESALTPRTKAVLVAHLFGGKMDLEPVSRFVREHDLLLFEDCAQAFRGLALSDTSSSVSLYSFGLLKTATALGGAMLRISDTNLLERMRTVERSYPSQNRGEYAIKLLKYLALILASRPIPYGLLVRACRVFRRDLDALLGCMTRSFPPENSHEQFFRRIRRRPCVPLLSLLNRRLRDFDHKRLARRASVGDRAARLLRPYVTLPGGRSRERTHWIFPVALSKPEVLVRTLRSHGFDATYATSNLVAVEAPAGFSSPSEAGWMMSNVVFLPIYPELPEGALDLLSAVVAEATA